MRDAVVGRVLVASLHQGISDILPTRLAFYESWLHAEGLRDGTIGLAPLYAVLSFLRQEGEDSYERITTCAGEYAAEWTVESMAPIERTLTKAAPAWLRSRLLLRLLGRLVNQSYTGSRVVSRLRRGHQPGRPRVGVLHGPRRGAKAAVRVLRRGIYAAPRAVRSHGARRSLVVPRHGTTGLSHDIRSLR